MSIVLEITSYRERATELWELMSINSDMSEWLLDNCTGIWEHVSLRTWWFENENDAMMFILRWSSDKTSIDIISREI